MKQKLIDCPEYAHLIDEWHPDNTLRPENLLPGSNKLISWRCTAYSHEWEAILSTRTKQKQNCPFCSNQRIQVGYNDLGTTNPSLAAQWDYERNDTDVTPQTVTQSSPRKAHWKCSSYPQTHRWETTIQSRNKGANCPYCANRKVLKGYNDLASNEDYQYLVREWHADNELYPDEVMVTANKKIKWQCLVHKTHTWDAYLSNRVSKKSGCPHCVKHDRRKKHELLVSHQLIHEVSPIDFEKAKTLPLRSIQSINWTCSLDNTHTWDAIVANRTRGSGCPYCSGLKVSTGVNDVATTHPLLALEWHESNDIKPTEVSISSDKVIVWQCLTEPEHTWTASVCNRNKLVHGCPQCLGRMTKEDRQKAYSDITHLKNEWNENNSSSFEESLYLRNTPFIWNCSVDNRHYYTATLYNRVVKGISCTVCSGAVVIQGVNDLASYSEFSYLLEQWDKNNEKKPTEVTKSSAYLTQWQCTANSHHTWKSTVYSRTRDKRSGCPQCARAQQSSRMERELAEHLISLGINVSRNDRQTVPGVELDLYFPDHKFAVEMNGLYWHSDKVREDKNYHYTKYEKAYQAGIQLVQIWEDDWDNRRDIVIKSILTKSRAYADIDHHNENNDFKPVGARKCKVVDITVQEAKEFLDAHHIQGFASGSFYISLQCEGDTVAVIVFKKDKDDEFLLTRYATKRPVVGGFTKLLKHFERAQSPTKIITFADLMISNGSLYEHTGFIKDSVLRPDYAYLYKGRRVHKFNFRLKRFRDDNELIYDESLSESQLAQLNDIPRIWDAGKIRYVKNY